MEKIKNRKSLAEAKEVIERNVGTIMADGFLFYVPYKEPVDEKPEQLIGTVNDDVENDMPNMDEIYHEVLACSDTCKKLKKGDKVMIDPRYVQQMRYTVVPLEDCVFFLMNEIQTILTIK